MKVSILVRPWPEIEKRRKAGRQKCTAGDNSLCQYCSHRTKVSQSETLGFFRALFLALSIESIHSTKIPLQNSKCQSWLLKWKLMQSRIGLQLFFRFRLANLSVRKIKTTALSWKCKLNWTSLPRERQSGRKPTALSVSTWSMNL